MSTETTLPTATADVVEPVQASELTEQTSTASEQPAEKQETPEDRIRRLELRLAKAHANNGRLHQERESLAQERKRLAEELEATRSKTNDEPKTLGEADIQKLADQRAREISEAADTAKRAQALIAAGKAFEGFEDSMRAIESDHELVSNGKPTKLMKAFLSIEPKDAVKVMQHIAENPDVSDSLKGLSGFQLGRKLLQIETEIAARQTKAPARPLTPEKPRGHTIKDQVAMSDAERVAEIRKARMG